MYQQLPRNIDNMQHLILATMIISCPAKQFLVSFFHIYHHWDFNLNAKNGHVVPTGQWYAPSAVINDARIAWYCMVLHGIAWYHMVFRGHEIAHT